MAAGLEFFDRKREGREALATKESRILSSHKKLERMIS